MSFVLGSWRGCCCCFCSSLNGRRIQSLRVRVSASSFSSNCFGANLGCVGSLCRNDSVNVYDLVVEQFKRGIDVFNVRLVLNGFIAHHVHDDFCHATRLSVSRTLEDDVLHGATAQMFDALLAQNPGYGIRDVALAAAVGSDDGGYSVTSEEYFGVVREGFETGNLEAFQFEHAKIVCCLPKPRPEYRIRKGDARACQYKWGLLRMSTKT